MFSSQAYGKASLCFPLKVTVRQALVGLSGQRAGLYGPCREPNSQQAPWAGFQA